MAERPVRASGAVTRLRIDGLPPARRALRTRLRTNARELVLTAVAGEISHPGGQRSPYRVGYDGVPRVLPGTGGIALNQRVGDPCIGLVGDHVEPGVSIRNYRQVAGMQRNAFNLALNTLACIGNRAVVVDGPCRGARGVVTGKHGGIDHVLIDFPRAVLRRLQIGDRIQVLAHGTGLRLLDHPEVMLFNCDPALPRRAGWARSDGRLQVPVTHRVPARLMGSGLGMSHAQRGDYDIQLFDRPLARRLGLDRLRFGDFIAIDGSDTRLRPAFHSERVSIGVIVHGDSTVAGHGPGVVVLATGPRRALLPVVRGDANLAVALGLRAAAPARPRRPLLEAERRRARHLPGRQPWTTSSTA